MIAIVLDELPNYSNAYEQGIDLMLTAIDYELECCLLCSDNFANFLKEQTSDSVCVKKLKQLELFEFKAYTCVTTSFACNIIESISKQEYNKLLNQASSIIVL